MKKVDVADKAAAKLAKKPRAKRGRKKSEEDPEALPADSDDDDDEEKRQSKKAEVPVGPPPTRGSRPMRAAAAVANAKYVALINTDHCR